MVQRAILFLVACAVAAAAPGCSKSVTSGSSGSGGGMSALVPWGKPSPQSQGISKYTQDHMERSVVSPAMGLEDKSQSGMAKVAAALSPSAVGKKVSAAFHRESSDPPSDAASAKSMSNGKKQPSADFYVSVARLAERTGKMDSAMEQYENALRADPNHLDALLSYARMLDRQGQLPKATQLYQRATKAHPKSASAFNDLGLCYARQGMFVDSAAALSDAVEIQPDRDLYRNNLATVLVELGRVDDAISHLAAVHGEAIAHYNVGFLLTKHGDTRGAAEQFALALRKKPDFVEARRWLDELNAGSMAGAPAAAPARAAPVSINRPVQRIDQRGPALRSPDQPPLRTTGPTAGSLRERPVDMKSAPRTVAPLPASQPTPPAAPVATPARGALPPVSVPTWSLKPGGADAPGIPPTPEQVRQEATVDPGTGNIDTPPAIRSLPPASSAYYPSSRY